MSVATVRAPHPVLAAWAALRATGAPRGALVTLVGADGGASKILGTQLALAEDGRAYTPDALRALVAVWRDEG